MGILRIGNKWLAWGGNLLSMPVNLYTYICNAFSQGWDRNRAIDTLGTQNNALMGGYLLAASNTTISIVGLLTTDTIKALTKDGLVGTVTVNGTISFSLGLKYGAFEIYRAGTLLGRYCLTERQGLQIINQVTGGLPNGLLGGTITTVWQRSNAFYSETNNTGYSISGTGWVTSAGAALTVGTIIPADPLNTTKCMAWVSSVQQDLQFVGKARNSVSIVPTAFYCNGDRYWSNPVTAKTDMVSHRIEVYCVIQASTAITKILCGESSRTASMLYLNTTIIAKYNNMYQTSVDANPLPLNTPIMAYTEYDGANLIIKAGWTNLQTGYSVFNTEAAPASLNMATHTNQIFNGILGAVGGVREWVDGVEVSALINSQHDTYLIDYIRKATRTVSGISTNLLQNIDLVYNAYNQTGYELWYNGTDYRIYPIASDGTTIITPAGYTSQGVVTAGNMPSVADSRMSTFKYALANSYALRQSVPEAYDATDPCAPKLLTYSELSALTNNIKVIKTEADGKITNLTIRQ